MGQGIAHFSITFRTSPLPLSDYPAMQAIRGGLKGLCQLGHMGHTRRGIIAFLPLQKLSKTSQQTASVITEDSL